MSYHMASVTHAAGGPTDRQEEEEHEPVSSWQEHVTSPGAAATGPHAVRQACPIMAQQKCIMVQLQ